MTGEPTPEWSVRTSPHRSSRSGLAGRIVDSSPENTHGAVSGFDSNEATDRLPKTQLDAARLERISFDQDRSVTCRMMPRIRPIRTGPCPSAFPLTGRPLPELSDETLSQLALVEDRRADDRMLAAQKSLEQAAFAVTDVDDANDFVRDGVGVVFAEDATPHTETALAALLEHPASATRGISVPASSRALTATRKGRPHARAERHDVSFNPVSPTMGVPFYLLLLSAHRRRSLWSFRYSLDIYWAVGRLHLMIRGGIAPTPRVSCHTKPVRRSHSERWRISPPATTSTARRSCSQSLSRSRWRRRG